MSERKNLTSSLSVDEWEMIKRISTELMAGISTADPKRTEDHIRGVLARNLMAANAEYDAKLADETVHKWEFGEHAISDCRIDWCGRYRGQRRDSGHSAADCSPDFCGREPGPRRQRHVP